MKPPALPIPRTGGGGTTMMKASLIACRRPNRLPMTALAGRPALVRSSKGCSAAKIAAAFEALVKVAPEKPAKATAFFTPGVWSMISVARRVTSSVRESDAPSGVWMTTMT